VSVGSDVAAARVKAGLTLQDVSDRTRVRRTVIERIEADDFSLCGGEVYARGHLRVIAGVIGADPVPLVAEFDRLHAPHAPSASEVFEAETSATAEPRGPNWTAAMAVALVVIVVIGVYQVAHRPSPAAPAATQSTSSSSRVPGTSPTATAATPLASINPGSTLVAQVPPSAQGVTVRLEVVSGRTWVSATGSGVKLYEGVLSAGAVRLLTDPKLVKIVVGNAGVVRVIVNGYDIGAPGGPGQVVRLSFGPGNPNASG